MIRFGVIIFALALTLAACGGGGGGGSVGPPGGGNPGGGNPSPSSSPGGGNPSATPSATHSPGGTPTPQQTPTPQPTRTPQQTPPPTPTPQATSTPYPPWPAVIYDVKTATSGVYIGEICNSVYRPPACADNYPTQKYHSLAYENVFTNWQTDMQTYMIHNGFQNWGQPNGNLNVVPMITWEPQNVLYTDIMSGKYDSVMQATAQAIAAFKYPIFIRPFHEFNGGWNSWGLVNQGADQQADTNFIAAWQRMVNIMRPIAPNIRFVWCYANASVPNEPWNQPQAAYPGDSYVDWIAFDAFNRGTNKGGWKLFAPLIQGAYNEAVKINATKPIMLAETGSNEYGDDGTMKAEWFQQMFADVGPGKKFPNLISIDYYDASSASGPHPYSFAINSSTPAFNAWTMGIRPTDNNGVLLFRGNGEPMAQITNANQIRRF